MKILPAVMTAIAILFFLVLPLPGFLAWGAADLTLPGPSNEAAASPAPAAPAGHDSAASAVPAGTGSVTSATMAGSESVTSTTMAGSESAASEASAGMKSTGSASPDEKGGAPFGDGVEHDGILDPAVIKGIAAIWNQRKSPAERKAEVDRFVADIKSDLAPLYGIAAKAITFDDEGTSAAILSALAFRTSDEILSVVKDLFEADQPVAAENLAEACAQGFREDKARSSALSVKATLCLTQNNPTEAQQSADRALILDPDNAVARMILADLFLHDGDIEKALEQLKKAVKAKPDSQTRSRLATLLMDAGDFASAAPILEEEVNENPDNEGARMLMCRSLGASGQIERARKILEEGLRINPDSEILLSEMGMFYLQSEAPAKALEYFERVLKITPDSPWPNIYAGMILAGNGDFERARKYGEKVLSLEPGNPAAHFHMARIEEQTGNLAKAVEWIEKTEKLDLNDEDRHLVGEIMRHLRERLDEEAKALKD